MSLKEGTLYIIRYDYENDNKWHWEGKFIRYEMNVSNELCDVFGDIHIYSMYQGVKNTYIPPYLTVKHHRCKFYDSHKVKNAKKARENMEKRSLDIILKRLVNEHFEW
jgi:hypothetical protein